MPHLVMEYSPDLEQSHDIKQLMNILHDSAKGSGLFTESAIKSRAAPVSYWRVGDLEQSSFIHVTAYLLRGRSEKQRHQFSQLLCRSLCENVDFVGSVSVDVREMNGEVYSKRLE